MTGRDVAIAALLGAQEFGFATAPLIALGCKMLRVCNLDTCPFGVATQNEKNRARFPGKPEFVENFMRYIAQNLREIMARLGVRSVEEMCGRTDLLFVREDVNSERAGMLDLGRILNSEQRAGSREQLAGDSCSGEKSELGESCLNNDESAGKSPELEASVLNEQELKNTLDVRELLPWFERVCREKKLLG